VSVSKRTSQQRKTNLVPCSAVTGRFHYVFFRRQTVKHTNPLLRQQNAVCALDR